MSLAHFDDLLNAARGEPRPQRLLMIFTVKELPDDASAAQRTAFQQGTAGVLAPVFYVDKAASALDSFEALCAEAGQLEKPWDVVFVGAMDEPEDGAPESQAVPALLERMLDDVKGGRIARFLAANREGRFIQLLAG